MTHSRTRRLVGLCIAGMLLAATVACAPGSKGGAGTETKADKVARRAARKAST